MKISLVLAATLAVACAQFGAYQARRPTSSYGYSQARAQFGAYQAQRPTSSYAPLRTSPYTPRASTNPYALLNGGRITSPYAGLTSPYAQPTSPYSLLTSPYAQPTSPYSLLSGGGQQPKSESELRQEQMVRMMTIMDNKDSSLVSLLPKIRNIGTDHSMNVAAPQGSAAGNPMMSMLMMSMLGGGDSGGMLGGSNSMMAMMSMGGMGGNKCASHQKNPMMPYFMAKHMGQSGSSQLMDMMECSGKFQGKPMYKYMMKRHFEDEAKSRIDALIDGVDGDDGLDCDEAWNMSDNALFSYFQTDAYAFLALVERCDPDSHTYIAEAYAEIDGSGWGR